MSRQPAHSTPETNFRRYAQYMKKHVRRTGALSERLVKAELEQKRAEQAAVAAARRAEKSAGFGERIGGAGDRGRIGDVQVGELSV